MKIEEDVPHRGERIDAIRVNFQKSIKTTITVRTTIREMGEGTFLSATLINDGLDNPSSQLSLSLVTVIVIVFVIGNKLFWWSLLWNPYRVLPGRMVM